MRFARSENKREVAVWPFDIILNGEKDMKKETQTVEFKQSWHDEYLKWICSFANAQGGKLIIGVDDSGKYVGVGNVLN